jgi:mannosyltransferase
VVADSAAHVAPSDAARSGADTNSAAGEGPSTRLDAPVVAGPAALATALALYDATARSLGFDEGATVTIAAQHGDALWKAIAHDGGNMSGYYALLHVLTGLFGNSLLVIRLPSVIATGATVAIVGVLALRLFDRRVALIAGVLSAISLPLVYWGQSARGYAAMTALVAASCLAFVTLLEGPQRMRWAAKAAYVISTTLAVYASFVAVLIVPAQLMTLMWHRRGPRPVASPLIACAVCCTPLAVLAAVRGSGQLFWVSRPNLTADKQMLESLTSAGLEPSFKTGGAGVALVILTVVLIVAIAVAIGRRAIGPAARRPTLGPALVLAWLVVPVALAWLESLVGQPIFLPRNLLLTLPAVALLLAVGLGDRRLAPVSAWGVVAALIVLRALPLAASYGVSPEDWKATTSYVLARAQPGDCIAFYPSDARMAFAYYLNQRGGRAPRSILPDAPWSPPRPYVEDYATLPARQLAGLQARCPRLWLVSSHEGQPDGPAGSRANYDRYLALRSALAARYGHHQAASFGYAAVVHVALLTAPRSRAATDRRGA